MSFLPVLLWSDLLIWLLALACLAIAWLLRDNPLQRVAWRRVGESRRGMASVVILLAFASVGLADSLHYRPALPAPAGQPSPGYSVQVFSLLDNLLTHLRQRNEKTYSAPLAAHQASKETLILPNGVEARVNPRLKYGAAHLGKDAKAAERKVDILTRLFWSIILSLCLALLVAVLTTVTLTLTSTRRSDNSPRKLDGQLFQRRFVILWRRIWRGRTGFAWNAVLISTALLIFIAVPLAVLSQHYHVFGTDKVGQDVLYQVLKSVRTALLIGLLTTLLMLPLGIIFGILSGYLRGWVDDVIQYIYTVINSIPGVLLIAAAILMMQVLIDTNPQWFATAAERADARLLALCFILGLTTWTGLARLLRGEALKLATLEYVQAAESFLVPKRRIVARHILPNVMHIVIIALVMDFSGLVLAEAVLSYIGIGVDPSMQSFGMMINNARMELSRDPPVWWSLLAAFAFMFTLVLAANVLADVVRDSFDPRLAP